MSDVTRILTAIEQGDVKAANQLLPLVYEELRRLAAQKMSRESPGHDDRFDDQRNSRGDDVEVLVHKACSTSSKVCEYLL